MYLNCTRTVREMMETVRMPSPVCFGGSCAKRGRKVRTCAARNWQEINIAGKIKGCATEKAALLARPASVGRAGRTNTPLKKMTGWIEDGQSLVKRPAMAVFGTAKINQVQEASATCAVPANCFRATCQHRLNKQWVW